MEIDGYKRYRKKGTQLLRPYVPGESMKGIAVNQDDELEEGGMIAINEYNSSDQWYVSKDYFEENYEQV